MLDADPVEFGHSIYHRDNIMSCIDGFTAQPCTCRRRGVPRAPIATSLYHIPLLPHIYETQDLPRLTDCWI